MKLRVAFILIIVAVVLPLLPAGGMPGSWSSVCFALTAPVRIKIVARVQVPRDQVSLYDLCDPAVKMGPWAAMMKQDDIGEAPSVGSAKYISAERLRPYLQRFLRDHGCDPAKVTLDIPDQITITRKAMRIAPEQVKSIYEQFILSHSPWNPKDLKITRIFFPDLPQLPAGNLTYKVRTSPNENFLGNVGVTIRFFVDGQEERSVHVMGRVNLYQEVVETTHPLSQHDIVHASDIELVKTDVADHPQDYATNSSQVVGKQLLCDVGPHQPILRRILAQARVVKRGGLVTIVYESQGLKLTAAGRTRQGGCVGDAIRVTNVMTKRTVLCQIVNADTVRALP